MAGMLLNALINAGLIPGMEGLYSAQRPAPLDAKEMRRQSPHVPPQDDPFEKGGGGVANTFGDIPTTGVFGSLSPQAAAAPTAANPVEPEPAPAPAPAPAAAPPLPPATEVPAGRPPGGMPVSLPTSAPAPAAAAPAQAPVRAPGGVGNWLNNNSNMLLAMGAGFAGAPSLGAGMSRAFAGAAPFAGQNQTLQALMARGVPQELAQAAIHSPEIAKAIIPQIFGGQTKEINGRLVDSRTGRTIADFSDTQKWQPFKSASGEDMLYQPSTGDVRRVPNPEDVPRAIPANIASQPLNVQLQLAPDGSTGTRGGRPVIKRNGRWEYQ